MFWAVSGRYGTESGVFWARRGIRVFGPVAFGWRWAVHTVGRCVDCRQLVVHWASWRAGGFVRGWLGWGQGLFGVLLLRQQLHAVGDYKSVGVFGAHGDCECVGFGENECAE